MDVTFSPVTIAVETETDALKDTTTVTNILRATILLPGNQTPAGELYIRGISDADAAVLQVGGSFQIIPPTKPPFVPPPGPSPPPVPSS